MFGGVGGGVGLGWRQHINVHVMLAVQQGCTALGGSQCAANLFYLSHLAVNDVVSMEKKAHTGQVTRRQAQEDDTLILMLLSAGA